MSGEVFLHVYYQGMHPCSPTKAAHQAALASWLCAGCSYPKPDASSVDIEIDDWKPVGGCPVNYVNGCGIVLAQTKFLEGLGSNLLKADLYIGRVTSASDLITGWVTVRSRQSVIVRGDAHVAIRNCPMCGRALYFAAGARYLFPAPSESHSIFESDLSGLVTRKSALDLMPKGYWSKSFFDELAVVEQPRDGLGVIE